MYILSILSAVSLMGPSYAGPKLNIPEMVYDEAMRQGVDPDLALAIAKVESNLDPHAVGPKGEIGVFQILPRTVRNPKQLFKTRSNIYEGVHRLAEYHVTCGDMGDAWFVCYNNGPRRRPRYPFLHPYYKAVRRQLGL